MSGQDKESLTQRFDELLAFIDQANSTVLNGKMPDLGNVDKKVALLCKDIEGADPEIAKQTQPMMAQMITKLDELAQSLNEYQAQKSGETQ